MKLIIIKFVLLLFIVTQTNAKEEESLDGLNSHDNQFGWDTAGNLGGPQWQAGREKTYYIEWFKVNGQLRHPEGEEVTVFLHCENVPDWDQNLGQTWSAGCQLDDEHTICYDSSFPTANLPNYCDSVNSFSSPPGVQKVLHNCINGVSSPSCLPPAPPGQGLTCAPSTRNGGSEEWGQGVWVTIQIKSKFGHVFHHSQLVEYDKIKCKTDHTFIEWFQFSKKTNIAGSGHCATSETVLSLVTSDLDSCCYDCHDVNYEVQIRVKEENPAWVKHDPNDLTQVLRQTYKKITFVQFLSEEVQYIREKDVVHISMGNTDQFAPLSTNIILCPEDMTPDPVRLADGIAQIPLDTSDLICTTKNAIRSVDCTNFEVICKPGDDFFFRLATFGEVYELGIRDPVSGNIEKAPGGLVPCNSLFDPVTGALDILIFNRHMKDHATVSTKFLWSEQDVHYDTNANPVDLECTAPEVILPAYSTSTCTLTAVPTISAHSAPPATPVIPGLPPGFPVAGDARAVCTIPHRTLDFKSTRRLLQMQGTSEPMRFLTSLSDRKLQTSASLSSIMVVPSKIESCIKQSCEKFDEEPQEMKIMVILGGMFSGLLMSSLIHGLTLIGSTKVKSKTIEQGKSEAKISSREDQQIPKGKALKVEKEKRMFIMDKAIEEQEDQKIEIQFKDEIVDQANESKESSSEIIVYSDSAESEDDSESGDEEKSEDTQKDNEIKLSNEENGN